ncbi:MAG: hypothetical protein EHM55_19455 [Acidobacteria bacterium]|nr:MAG: hypothetical protein EHM55_19455 [Acidobacteriota bacterium]
MRIDSTHRGWAVASGIALSIAGTGYVGSVAVADRPWSGGSAIGLAYGIAGFAMMVFAGLLAGRKKVPIWRVGRAQTWMRGHLWLGLLSFPIILFHSGLAFGGSLTRVMMWTFVAVVVSGVVGAALQHFLPRLMFARVPMETIFEQIPHVRAQLLVEADGIVSEACGGLAVLTDPAAERTQAAASKLQSAVRIDGDAGAPLREFYLSEMRSFVAEPGNAHPLAAKSHADQVFARLRTLLPASFHGALSDLENICEEERQLSRQQRLHAWLHGWLLTHIPLSFALLVLAIIHIVTALRY